MPQGLGRALAPLATALTLPLTCCGSVIAQVRTLHSSATWAPIAPMAPVAPGAPMVPIAPSVVTGVNVAGTVRVNNLANLEFILNAVANCVEVGGIAWGMLCIYQGIKDPVRRRGRMVLGLFLIAMGLSAPSMVNWLTASARDCGSLF